MRNIAVVDDSRVIQKQTKGFLIRVFGEVAVHMYSSGEEAFEGISKMEEKIDFAIFDYNMDGITGLELAEKVKEYIPVGRIFLCTANIQQGIRDKAEELGVTFLEKPMTLDLMETVHEKMG